MTINPNKTRKVRKRKEYCKHGHKLTDDNVYISNGNRTCKLCQQSRARIAYRKRRLLDLRLNDTCKRNFHQLQFITGRCLICERALNILMDKRRGVMFSSVPNKDLIVKVHEDIINRFQSLDELD